MLIYVDGIVVICVVAIEKVGNRGSLAAAVGICRHVRLAAKRAATSLLVGRGRRGGALESAQIQGLGDGPRRLC